MSTVNGPLLVSARIKEAGDWPQAVVMLAIYLEKHGYLAVKDHFESLQSAIGKEYLEGLHLLDYGLILLTSGRINSDEFQTIKDINKIRNKWMHRKEKYGYKIGTAAKREYLPLLEKGEQLLQKLFTTTVYVSRR